MSRILGVIAAMAVTAIFSAEARAEVIDVFSFTEGDWSSYTVGGGEGSFQSGDVLTGSFTGTVEPDGLIEQTDLTAFNVEYTRNGNPFADLGLPDLTLFSYDVNGGASSLDLAGSFGASHNICVGAATSLDANCTLDFDVAYPVGTVGVVEAATLPDFISGGFPTITLVSSSTGPQAAPEPASGALLLAGAALVLIGCLRRGKTHNAD